MNKLIVLDNGYFQHRAIFSYINIEDKAKEKGEKTYFSFAHYNYMSMIISCLKIIEIDYNDVIILAQDRGSWRKEYYKEYKADREEKKEQIRSKDWWTEMYQSFNIFLSKLEETINWVFVAYPKVEADDWASVICRTFPDKEIVLVSSDTDWEQLAKYSNVKVFSLLSKKYKDIKNPYKILQDKIFKKEYSDNILTIPETDKEIEDRKKIVSLLELPEEIENPLKWELESLPIKNITWAKIPFQKSIKPRLYKLYEEKK